MKKNVLNEDLFFDSTEQQRTNVPHFTDEDTFNKIKNLCDRYKKALKILEDN